MKQRFQLAVLLLTICAVAAAQVEPAATAARNLVPPGNLNYSLRYSQSAEFGGGLGNWQTSTISGSFAYANGKNRLPFAVQYGGGYNASIAGPSYGTGFFQHLLLSQGMVWRRWNFSVADGVSVTPQAPTLGFTGIPGIGEPITVSIPVPVANPQSILTLNTQVVDNNANAQLSHAVNHKLSMNLGGANDLFRYPNDDGLDTNTNSGNGGLSWRLDARNSLSGNYLYSQFSYPDLNFSFQTQSAVFGMDRIWTRRISSKISAGPQWTASSNTASMPATIGVAVSAAVTYQSGYNTGALTYSRGVNSGAGFLLGAETDTASVNYSRVLNRNATLGFSFSDMRTAGLGSAGVTDAKYGGTEVSRRLSKHLSLFANYSAMTQSTSSSLPGNTLGQMLQTIGFGISYSPRETRLAR